MTGKFTFNDRNPALDEMKDRGWAYVHKSKGADKYGEPHTDDARAQAANPRTEVRIIYW